MDPLENFSAGIVPPFKYAKILVLVGGGECDLDPGNCEHFLSVVSLSDHKEVGDNA